MLWHKAQGAGGVGGNSFEIYGVVFTGAAASHNSTSVGGTLPLGTAYSDREIWVVVPTMSASSSYNSAAASVLLNGNAATKMFEIADSGYTDAEGISYWRYIDNGALGSSAYISVNFSSTQVHTGVMIFTAQSGSVLLDSYGDAAQNSAPTTSTISTSSSGWAFYCALSQNASTGTISTFANDGAFDMGTNEWVVYGFNSPEDNGTVLITHPSSVGTQNRVISGISVEAP